jgi:hypothetical protein
MLLELLLTLLLEALLNLVARQPVCYQALPLLLDDPPPLPGVVVMVGRVAQIEHIVHHGCLAAKQGEVALHCMLAKHAAFKLC